MPRQEDDDPSLAVLHAAPVGIWVTDGAGRVLDVNAAAAELLGHAPGELVGRSIVDLAHPDDAPEGALLRAAGSAEVVAARVRLRRRDGTWALVEGRARALADGRVVVVAHDVTELERAEHARAESEREFRAIFELALSGKASSDPATGRFLRVNRKLCEITGYSEEELLQRTAADVTHPDDRAADEEAVRRVLAGEASGWTREKRFVRRDGAIAWVIATGTILRDASGIPTRSFATIHDITDRKRMESALRDADRRKDEFLAVLSHELRNPLAPMRSSLAVLARAAPASPEAQRAREVLDRQVGHLSRLVDDLLDLARITRGNIQLRRERVDLAGIVVRTAEDHRAVLAAAGVTLAVRVFDEGAAVDGDATRLAQVLGNLLHNAGKFTPRGGRVEVVLEAERKGEATLRVRDTGFGIDPAVLPRLFEPFAVGDLALDRTRGGLGLGLALVKRLVDLHGGRVSARSDGPGRGSEFTIVLPLLEDAAAGAPSWAPAARREPDEPRRVLVIDDNVDAAETLRDILEMAGHAAVVAHDGPSALAVARAFGPDAVLCDIGLPGMDGYAVARALRRDPALAGVFLVALTGYALPDDVRRATDAGFDAHVAKPPPLEEIDALLRRAGARRGPDADERPLASAEPARPGIVG
jgi:PAS domain S-box-containing protein